MTHASGPVKTVFLLQELKLAGSQTQALELARGLDPARFRVEIWTLMQGLDLLPLARSWGLSVRQLGRGGCVWPAALARLAAALKRERPGLLVLYTGIPNIWGRLLGRLAGLPLIVATCRGSLEPRRQADRWLWRLADHHICNAHWLKELLTRTAGVNPGVVSVIPNGVDVQRFHPAPEEERPGTPVVLGMGRMEWEKGHETLLRAFNLIAGNHPRAQLWLVGEGALKDRLTAQAAASPWRERIQLLPPTGDAPSLLRRVSILALPSRHEGMPNVLLEAMATGLPVVASHLGGVVEVVKPGRTGIMAPPGDVAAWAAALDLLLEEPALGRSWGQAARQLAMADYSLRAMVEAHTDLFERLLAQGRG